MEKRITAKMILDSSGFNDSIKGVNSSLRGAQSELKLASEGIKGFGKDSEKLKSVQEALAKQVELHTKKVDLYKQSMEKTTFKMQDNIKERDKLKTSLDQANKKYDETVKIYGIESKEARKAKEEVDKLSHEHEKSSKAVEANAKQIQGYQTNLNKAETQMVKSQAELKKINTELDKSQSKWLATSETLKDHSEKLKKTGSAVSGVGDSILKMTAPIVGAGIASAKLGTDFNEAMSTVATLIPGNQKRLQELKSDIQNVAIETGKSTSDIANGTYQVVSAFGDASDTMQKVKIDAKAATAGMATTTDALNLSSAVMKGYGDTTAKANEKVMDMSFMTVKLGQTDFPSLASSIGKVVPLSNELKVKQEEMFTVFATGTGVTGNASEVSTQYRGILQSLMAPTKEMTKLIKEQGFADGKAMVEKKGLAGTIELITKKAKETNTPLQQYIGSIEGQTLALALAGEQSAVYVEKLEGMKNSSGAMNEAFDEQTKGINKTGFAFKQGMIKMQVAGQKMGDAMGPLLEKGADLLTKLADKLGSLSNEQLESIAKWGLMAVASGGALKVLGGGISTVGTLAGGLSKVTGALGKAKLATDAVGVASGVASAGGVAGLAGGLGGLALAALPWVAGATAVAGAGYLIHKKLSEDAIPTVDIFEDTVITTGKNVNAAYSGMAGNVETETIKISEGTKKAVGAYMDLDKGATDSLNSLYFNSKAITDKNKDELIGKYAEMGTMINQGLQKKRDEDISSLNEFFGTTNTLTDSEEALILQKTNSHYEERKGVTDTYQNQITDIIQNAADNNRGITEQEYKTIMDIKTRQKEESVKVLSENEVEAGVILEKMKEYDGRMTAEQASEHINTLNESRDKAVKIANDEYEKRVAAILRTKAESSSMTQEQADKLIAEAARQRDGIVEKAEDTRLGAIDKMRSMNSDLDTSVETTTGKILSTWDKISRWWNGWKPEKKNFSYAVSGGGGGGRATVSEQWTGSTYFKGGLTTLHERGEEIYDLPQGTRIYNAERSEQMVMATAQSVAEKVANSMFKNFNGGSGEQTIIVPVNLDGRELAKVIAPYVSRNLATSTMRRR